MFAKKPTAELASLAKQINELVAKKKDQKLAAVINFTGERTDEFTALAKEFGEKNKLEHVAVTVTSDGNRFKINEKADLTVMHYKGKKVQFNFAAKGKVSKKDITKIVRATDTIVE